MAFTPEIDVVEDDAENPGADRGKFVTGALDRVARIPAAVHDEDHAAHHCRKDHGIGNTAEWG